MTIIEAINQIDALVVNTYTQADKIEWLSRLDGQIVSEIVSTHEDADEVTYAGYDTDTPLDTELIAQAPYDEMYIKWLEAQINYANGEYARYSSAITLFNAVFTAYRDWYNRHHMPLGKSFKVF